MAVIVSLLYTLTQVLLYSGMSSSSSTPCDVKMIQRQDWGARPPRQEEKMPVPVPHIFIHHTVSQPCADVEACKSTVRGIQNYHMDNLGWGDIGYNFLIGGDGSVFVARGWDKVGAHTLGFNHNSVAFSLIGTYSTEHPPDVMLDAVKGMIECAKQNGYVTKDFKLHGHRDAGQTECPGQALYDVIKEWDRFQPGPLTR